MDGLNIKKAILAGYDWGGRAACVVAALYPHRCIGLISCNGYNIQNIKIDSITPDKPENEKIIGTNISFIQKEVLTL